MPRADAPVCHPTQGRHLGLTHLPRRDAMDPHVSGRGLERHVMHQAEAMDHTRGAVVPRLGGHAPGLLGCLHLRAQRGRIAVFHAEQSVQTVGMPRRDGGRIGTQTVCGHDALEGGGPGATWP
jgi:hypothetical protein